MNLEVLRSQLVTFNRGYAGFARCQVTVVRLGIAIGYVRENRKASSLDHFLMSSGERLGHKADGNRIGVEVLELAADKAQWDAIAREVARIDALKRPVRRNRLWTIANAHYVLKGSGR